MFPISEVGNAGTVGDGARRGRRSLVGEAPAVDRADDGVLSVELLESVDDIAFSAPETITQLDGGERPWGGFELVSDFDQKWIWSGRHCWGGVFVDGAQMRRRLRFQL